MRDPETGASTEDAPAAEAFDDLVESTGGPQPGRRLFHAINGLVIAGILSLDAVDSRTMALGLGAVVVILVISDLIRLRSKQLNTMFYRVFRHFVSPRERDRLASSTWYIVGCLVVVLLYSKPVALAGILVLALADPAASYVGRRWGRRRIGTGTVLGTTVFFLVSLAVFVGFAHPAVALMAAVVSTAFEPLPWRIDDNLTVPVVASTCLFVLETVWTL